MGLVKDLSTAGMRVACTGKPPVKVGQIQKIRIKGNRASVVVTGKVIWVRRTRFRKYDTGIQFIAMKPAVAGAIDQLARFGFIRQNQERLDDLTGTGSGRSASARQRRGGRSIRASIDLPDYYALLDVPADASQDEIREAYRKLARIYHPDVNREDVGQAKFIEINEAYEILKDPERRMTYDLRNAG
ncbi:MAG: DnaJ domain-containing protein [Planctomycetota bacterium]|jgi:DnaJ-domain-containing protein 1